MEGTYMEYSDWADDGVPETVTHQYRRALQQMGKCKPYEEALVTMPLSHCFRDPLVSLIYNLMQNDVSGSRCDRKGGDYDFKMFYSLLTAKTSLPNCRVENLN